MELLTARSIRPPQASSDRLLDPEDALCVANDALREDPPCGMDNEAVFATFACAFEDQVAATPDAIAVTFETTMLSYAELNARANRLAFELIDRGAGPEQFVAIALQRSIELVVAWLAVLKSGAAYLPLDPSYPRERLAAML